MEQFIEFYYKRIVWHKKITARIMPLSSNKIVMNLKLDDNLKSLNVVSCQKTKVSPHCFPLR